MFYYLAEVKETFEVIQEFDEEGNLIKETETDNIISKEVDFKRKQKSAMVSFLGKSSLNLERYIIKSAERLEDERIVEIKKEEIEDFLEQYNINKDAFYRAYVKN